jgi:mRNA interferase RelE/StbE
VIQWQIAWTPSSTRSLGALPVKVATAALEVIYGPVSANPHRAGKPLRFELEGLYSARRADYRVIHEIDEAQHRVVIHLVLHRRV